MSTMTLSPSFEVLIPEDVREALHLAPEDQFRVVPYDGRVKFIPVRTVQSMRGFLEEIDTNIEREED
jgi:bifunctional DNA-binding transcriptional regulator/antitoxin component of YhaV-PrlF toxin-antitoxin module